MRVLFLLGASLALASTLEDKLRKKYLALTDKQEQLEAQKAAIVTKWLPLCKAKDQVLDMKPSGSPGCVPPRVPPPEPPKSVEKK